MSDEDEIELTPNGEAEIKALPLFRRLLMIPVWFYSALGTLLILIVILEDITPYISNPNWEIDYDEYYLNETENPWNHRFPPEGRQFKAVFDSLNNKIDQGAVYVVDQSYVNLSLFLKSDVIHYMGVEKYIDDYYDLESDLILSYEFISSAKELLFKKRPEMKKGYIQNYVEECIKKLELSKSNELMARFMSPGTEAQLLRDHFTSKSSNLSLENINIELLERHCESLMPQIGFFTPPPNIVSHYINATTEYYKVNPKQETDDEITVKIMWSDLEVKKGIEILKLELRLDNLIIAFFIIIIAWTPILIVRIWEKDLSENENELDHQEASLAAIEMIAALKTTKSRSINMSNRGVFMLSVGILVAVLGMGLFVVSNSEELKNALLQYEAIDSCPPDSDDLCPPNKDDSGRVNKITSILSKYILLSIRPFTLLIVIEAIAWFLLKQYRLSVTEFKFFHRLYLIQSNQLAAYQKVNEKEDLSDAELIVTGALLSQKFNEPLKAGETTEALEMQKAEDQGSPIFSMLSKIIEKS